MVSKLVIFMVVLVKTITSQRLMPPINYPQLYPENILERFSSQPQYQQIAAAENDAICKNLASAIQNVIFDRFSQNCMRTPVFGPIAAPLVNEIKNNLCTCPVCSNVNISPNSYSKSYIAPNAVSNVIKSSVPNVISKPYPRGNPNVSLNRNYDLLSLLKSFSVCDCGCRGPVV